MNTPTISVIVATYNSSRTIDRCLNSIRSQQYPQDKIEILIADGGSTDNTKKLVQKYHVRWISIDPLKQNAEYNKSIGLEHAHNEIAAFIDHDNVLPHNTWFTHMILPLKKEPSVIGVETLHYHYDPQSSLLDRYFALFGSGDPIVRYLGRADRLSYIDDHLQNARNIIDHGTYYVVQFDAETMPTIGANGYLVRRKELLAYAKSTPGEYFDMDVNIDLIRNGYNTFAFVKESILHLTGYGSVWFFLWRRILFQSQYHAKNRRYGVLTQFEKLKLCFVIIACLTFVIPFYDSIRGWRKIHDSAWFLHPILSFSFVVLYGWVIIKRFALNYAKTFLEE